LEGKEAERVLRDGGLRRRLWPWILAYKLMAPRDRWITYEVSSTAGERSED